MLDLKQIRDEPDLVRARLRVRGRAEYTTAIDQLLAGPTPGQPAGKLIINKQTGQWGTQYDEKQDLARVDANVTLLAEPVEMLTIAIVDTPDGATLVTEWARIRAEVPFVVH